MIPVLAEFIRKIKNPGVAFKAASDALVMIKRRVELHGKGLEGKFDGYSTTPYYRNRKERPIAKGGRIKNKRTGQPMASMYFEGGYAQFAAKTKRGGKVNLSASGNMLSAMQAQSISSNTAILSFTQAAEAFKAHYVNQRRPFFGFTKPEETLLKKLIKSYLVD